MGLHLTVVASELANNPAGGDIPVEYLAVAAAGDQLCVVRGDVHVADLAAVGLVGLDVDAPVRVPEAEGAVLPAAEAVVTVAVEADGQNRSLVTLQHVHLTPRQLQTTAAAARHRIRFATTARDESRPPLGVAAV